MEQNKNQLQIHSQKQLQAKQEEVLAISTDILKDISHLSMAEMRVDFKQALQESVMSSVFKEKEKGPIAYGVTKIIVERFFGSLGFASKPSDMLLETITVDTLEHFKYETLSDIILFYKMARQGKFGVTSRGVDSNLVFGDWFPKYMDLKSQEREQLINQEKNVKNQSVHPTIDIQKAYAKFMSNTSMAQKHIDQVTLGFNRDDLEYLIRQWENSGVEVEYINLLKKKRREIKE